MKTYTIITGASAGIGLATAEILAQNNKNLILVARRIDKLDELKSTLESKNNIEVLTYQVDLSILIEIDEFFKKISQLKIEALINNAGLALGTSSFENANWEDFNQMIDINIKAFTKVAQLAIPLLKKTEGHIVNLSSIASREAYEGGNVYCGTKAFVKMISKALRIDLLGTGIRVTDIAPGAVNTEFATVRFKGDKKSADKLYEGFTPLYAKDIAEAINFALSRPKSVNIEQMLIMPTDQATIKRIAKMN